MNKPKIRPQKTSSPQKKNPFKKNPVTITAPEWELDTLASMRCEHLIRGEKSCDEADLERGGCCNACWTSRWAKRQLKKAGK